MHLHLLAQISLKMEHLHYNLLILLGSRVVPGICLLQSATDHRLLQIKDIDNINRDTDLMIQSHSFSKATDEIIKQTLACVDPSLKVSVNLNKHNVI